MSAPLLDGLVAGLGRIARHGRFVLAGALVVGLASPTLAGALRPHIGWMVAILLTLSAWRIGARAALGALDALGRTALLVLVLQVALPFAVLAIERGFGLGGPLALALLVMTTTAPIAGTPNLTILVGGDPAPALRLLVVATGLLPLTVVPVFLASGALGDPFAVLPAALRLAGLIGAAATIGFLARARWLRSPTPAQVAAVDGFGALVMAVLVIGLMQALGERLRADPVAALGTTAAAFVANFGFQIVGAALCRRFGHPSAAPAVGISTGNRNFVLLLAALPDAITAPIMLFVGGYQIPMYLTPLLLGGFHRRMARPIGNPQQREV
ncbi:MAG: hypothetical protein LWW93_06285 [Hyphomicrobiales bacterium]|nr:hypothetical protein [Hyphomicrobiales bacterium]